MGIPLAQRDISYNDDDIVKSIVLLILGSITFMSGCTERNDHPILKSWVGETVYVSPVPEKMVLQQSSTHENSEIGPHNSVYRGILRDFNQSGILVEQEKVGGHYRYTELAWIPFENILTVSLRIDLPDGVDDGTED